MKRKLRNILIGTLVCVPSIAITTSIVATSCGSQEETKPDDSLVPQPENSVVVAKDQVNSIYDFISSSVQKLSTKDDITNTETSLKEQIAPVLMSKNINTESVSLVEQPATTSDKNLSYKVVITIASDTPVKLEDSTKLSLSNNEISTVDAIASGIANPSYVAPNPGEDPSSKTALVTNQQIQKISEIYTAQLSELSSEEQDIATANKIKELVAPILLESVIEITNITLDFQETPNDIQYLYYSVLLDVSSTKTIKLENTETLNYMNNQISMVKPILTKVANPNYVAPPAPTPTIKEGVITLDQTNKMFDVFNSEISKLTQAPTESDNQRIQGLIAPILESSKITITSLNIEEIDSGNESVATYKSLAPFVSLTCAKPISLENSDKFYLDPENSTTCDLSLNSPVESKIPVNVAPTPTPPVAGDLKAAVDKLNTTTWTIDWNKLKTSNTNYWDINDSKSVANTYLLSNLVDFNEQQWLTQNKMKSISISPDTFSFDLMNKKIKFKLTITDNSDATATTNELSTSLVLPTDMFSELDNAPIAPEVQVTNSFKGLVPKLGTLESTSESLYKSRMEAFYNSSNTNSKEFKVLEAVYQMRFLFYQAFADNAESIDYGVSNHVNNSVTIQLKAKVKTDATNFKPYIYYLNDQSNNVPTTSVKAGDIIDISFTCDNINDNWTSAASNGTPFYYGQGTKEEILAGSSIKVFASNLMQWTLNININSTNYLNQSIVVRTPTFLKMYLVK